jgi:hypothetical protein
MAVFTGVITKIVWGAGGELELVEVSIAGNTFKVDLDGDTRTALLLYRQGHTIPVDLVGNRVRVSQESIPPRLLDRR